MHHKRRRPKSRRAGCLLCKPHKANGRKGSATSLRIADRRRLAHDEGRRDGVADD